jgi:tight adherence protein B
VRKLALLVVAALAAVVAVVAALPAGAAQSGPTLSESAARFPDRYYFLTLPKPQRLTAAKVRVTENGAPVRNLAVTRPGEQGFVTYLVVDASNSMRGKPIADAMKAARAFAAQRNPNSPLGVIFFNDNVTVALKPTRNAQDINEVLAKPPVLREKTHLYDALDKTSDELLAAGAPGGAIVLLSDGDDVGSKATQEVAMSRLKQQKARVFGVGLRSGAYTPDALQAFAAETGGSYAETGQSAQLTGIFDALGFKLSNEYLLLWRSQAAPQKKINVAVRVAGYPQPVTTSYTTPSLGLTIEPLDESFVNKLVQSWFFLLLVVAAVMGLLFWGIRSIVEARQRNLRTRMAMFVEVGGHPAGHEHPDFAARVDQIDQALSKRGGRLGRFSDMCEVGGVGVSPTVLLVGSIGGGFILGVILAVAFGPVWFLTAVVPYLAVRWYVKYQLGRTRRTFAEQLPDNLEVLAGALRAGHSLVGGFSVMADHAAPPSGKEFRRVVTDEQVGIPLEDSLRVVGQRMDNRDMSQVAMIALLQRETGSSSAEVIDQVAENVRGRLEIRRLVRVLTAQGRMARWIVSLMPLVLVFLILGINPEFLEPLFHTTIGVVAVIIATIMVIMGSLVIKRIVEIKV